MLFADDTALVADSEDKLQKIVEEFDRVCVRRKLKINVNKSKVMRCSRREDGRRMNVCLNGERLEEVDNFKYLGSQIGRGEEWRRMSTLGWEKLGRWQVQ